MAAAARVDRSGTGHTAGGIKGQALTTTTTGIIAAESPCRAADSPHPSCRYPRPVLIKARLTGHEFDLLTLAELFGAGDPAVAADDEGYHLRFTAPQELFGDGGGLHNAASVLLRRVNGVARTLSSDVRPVGLTGASATRPAGNTRSCWRIRSRYGLAPTRSGCWWVGSSLLRHYQHRVRAVCSWPKPTRTWPRSWTSSATPTRHPTGLSCTSSTRSCSTACPGSSSAVGYQGPDQYVHCLGQSERGQRRPGPSCPAEG
jgi:hypothetical protein